MEVILIANSVIINLRKVGENSLQVSKHEDCEIKFFFFLVNTEISSEKQYNAVEKEYSFIPRKDQLIDKLENIY